MTLLSTAAAKDRWAAAEALIRDLAHDLRQPLSTIESSAYYLKLVSRPENAIAAQQFAIISQQVEEASRLLTETVLAFQSLSCQREDTVRESRAFTNSATAGVT
jgi:signal transduction histidine kinase